MGFIMVTCDRCGSRMVPGSDKFASLFTCAYCGNTVVLSDESSDVRAAQIQASVQQAAMDYQHQRYMHEAERDQSLLRDRGIIIGLVAIAVSVLMVVFLHQSC